ncbi:hypothetical protein OAS18_03235 [Nitrospinaceae bacterium]|nr:hypothetical protein [Nitrospinaceae bacterium]
MSAYPVAVIRSGSAPLSTKYLNTAVARDDDSSQLVGNFSVDIGSSSF